MIIFGYLFLACMAALLVWGLSVEVRETWRDIKK